MKAKAIIDYIKVVASIPYYATLLVAASLELAVSWLRWQAGTQQIEPDTSEAVPAPITGSKTLLITATLQAFNNCKKDETLVGCMNSIERLLKNRAAVKKAEGKDRHLYAVLQPTRQEALGRIENVLNESDMSYIANLYSTVIESLENV